MPTIDVFKALGDPTRQAIVDRLSRGPATISQLRAGHSMSLTAIAKHVALLERSGLLTRRKAGRDVTCTLRREPLGEAQRWLADRQRYWSATLDRLDAFLADERPGADDQPRVVGHPDHPTSRKRAPMTTTTTATVTRTVPASIERVFDAWSQPELLVRWYSPNPDLELRFDGEVAAGAEWAIHMGDSYTARGVYRIVERPSLLEFTWRWEHEPDVPDSVVRVELAAADDDGAGTTITLTHRDLPDPDDAAGHAEGWALSLDRLTQLLAASNTR